MADNTPIEWTEATWNPITGCSIKSPGCASCYAMLLAGTRLANIPSRVGLTQPSKAGPVWTGEVRFNEQWLDQPLRWKRPRMIFVCAHGDLFHESVPDEWIDRIFAVMALAPQHTFQVLTKRSARMREYVSRAGQPGSPIWGRILEGMFIKALGGAPPPAWPLPNVWLGVSVEDQQRADERIPDLLATPAAIRWISAEPLLGPVDLEAIANDSGFGEVTNIESLSGKHHFHELGSLGLRSRWLYGAKLDWIVVGGESGKGVRPMHPDWVRSLRDQCAAADVPFFFKQWGSWLDERQCDHAGRICFQHYSFTDEDEERGAIRQWEDGHWAIDIGKKRAGRLLDGVQHNGMPELYAQG